MIRLGIVLAAGLLAFGCSKQPEAAAGRSLATAKTLAAAEMIGVVPWAMLGDRSYAQVSSAALPALYEDFRGEIFRKGVVKWDERFDCNHFAAYYAALAQTKFYLASFQSRSAPQSLAVGTFWYHTAAGPHAIVVAVTERGPVFIEPQSGQEVKFSSPPQVILSVF